MKFNELGIKKDLVEVLEKNGIHNPTEIQEKGIPVILNGKDVIGEAQTGTGKTLSFLLPIFQEVDLKNKNIQGLIISPTRELAIQITDECNKLSRGKAVNVLSLYGGKDMAGQLKKLKNDIHIVVATPGRLIDHIEKGNISLKGLKTLVLDEADQMLFMGFRNEIDKILSYAPKKKKMLCFSATMDSKVKKLAYRYMNEPTIISVSNNDKVTLDEIKQEVVFTTDRWKRNALCKALNEDNPFMAIIFCRTKRRADELEEYMARGKFNCEKIHSDIKQSKRERIMKNFRDAKIQYLIATDVAARGIDIDGVDYIYNYDTPETPESYIHRIGRTGRQGSLGYTCMFVADKDKGHLKQIQETINMEIPVREVEFEK